MLILYYQIEKHMKKKHKHNWQAPTCRSQPSKKATPSRSLVLQANPYSHFVSLQ